MKRKSATDELKETIALLKVREAQELQALKQQFRDTVDGFKPMNLIKSSIKSATATPGIKSTLVKGALGLATGYLSKRLLFGVAKKPAKKVLTTLLELGVAKFIANRLKKKKAQPAKEATTEKTEPAAAG